MWSSYTSSGLCMEAITEDGYFTWVKNDHLQMLHCVCSCENENNMFRKLVIEQVSTCAITHIFIHRVFPGKISVTPGIW